MRSTRRAAARAIILGTTLFGAACARAVSVGTDPSPVYAVQVVNTLGEDMIVSYDAGTGPAILGTVRANGQERFVITSRTATSVRITARNTAGTRSAGPYTVELQPGATPEVRLR